MEVFPIRTEPWKTFEVWHGSGRYAVVEFEGGRLVCMTHDHECPHALAARAFVRDGYSGGSFSLTANTDIC